MAHTLSEALNRLDPERPLRTSEELRQFFVQRPHSPIDEIEILHNLSVPEYKNDTVWYDVHPFVKPLIDDDA